MKVSGGKMGKECCDVAPNELIFLYFVGFLSANFGENRSRNATLRVSTDGYTNWQTTTHFIACPMLYAIAMG